jgi:hypothetical protein
MREQKCWESFRQELTKGGALSALRRCTCAARQRLQSAACFGLAACSTVGPAPSSQGEAGR